MLKKQFIAFLMSSFLIAPSATQAIEAGPLAAVSFLSYIGGIFAEHAQKHKPRRKRSKVGQAMQAAGAVGLATSAFLAASEVEPDVCVEHVHYHPAHRHLYSCCHYGCRFYRSEPIYVVPYYPRPSWSVSFGYRFP